MKWDLGKWEIENTSAGLMSGGGLLIMFSPKKARYAPKAVHQPPHKPPQTGKKKRKKEKEKRI